MQTAVSLLTKDDLSDTAHLQAYQRRMRQLYTLEKFAFVDTNGLIYTADGTMNDIEKYSFDYDHINEPEISVRDNGSGSKSVIIAVPVDRLPLDGKTLTVCFMEIDMNTMLDGVSLQSDNNDTTFCNIYTKDGTALTDMVLGGLASEDNLLKAMERADFDDNASADDLRSDFEKGRGGIVSFTYNGVKETLSYTPIDGTDWMLTYLIRESVVSDNISSVSEGIFARSLVQTFLTSMSHERRTPMNAIIGLNAIALNAPELSDKTRDHLEKIGSSANHLLSLINDILDMSRIESGKTVLKNEDFSFSKLLEQINTIFGAQCADKGLNYNCRVIGSVAANYISVTI